MRGETVATAASVVELGAGENPHPGATVTVDIREDLGHIDHGGVDIGLDTLPIDDNAADSVHLYQVIEHIQPERIGHVIREIDRILRPGGTVVMETPHSGTIDANTDPTHYGTGGTTPAIRHYFSDDDRVPTYWPDIDWDVDAWADIEGPTILRESWRLRYRTRRAALSQALVKLPFVTACVRIEAKKR